MRSSTGSTAVRARDLHVRLGGRPVLHGVGLSVPRSGCVALLGTNGSGKSTLIRTMLGLLSADRGDVAFFDGPHQRPGGSRWTLPSQRVAYVPQRTRSDSGVPATVGEIALSGRLARHPVAGYSRSTDRAAVRRAVAAVGLGEHLDTSVADLSGGEQQRVLIARALAGEPDLLVLDEPTAGVDAENQDVVADILGERLDAGVAVLLVAHGLGPMASLVDTVVVLADGRVVYDGAPATAPRESWGHDHEPPDWPGRAAVPTSEGVWS